MTRDTKQHITHPDFVAIDWQPFTSIMPRELARRLASGGTLSVDHQTVTGGDPNHPQLPRNARELTPTELEHLRKSMLQSRGIDTSPTWWAVTKAAFPFILDITVLVVAVALILAAINQFIR